MVFFLFVDLFDYYFLFLIFYGLLVGVVVLYYWGSFFMNSVLEFLFLIVWIVFGISGIFLIFLGEMNYVSDLMYFVVFLFISCVFWINGIDCMCRDY